MFPFGSRFARRLNHEHSIEFFQELRWRETIEILQYAVIGQDPNLVIRKNDAEEVATLTCALPGLKYSGSRGASMMPIRDIKRRHPGKLLFNRFQLRCFPNCPARV